MIQLKWTETKQIIDAGLDFSHITDVDDNYLIYVRDGSITFWCLIAKESPASLEQTEFENNYLSNSQFGLYKQPVYQASFPFAKKVTEDGKKLFKRVHGVKASLSGDTTISLDVPYNSCKINGLEIVWAPAGLQADLKVYDTPQGHIQIGMGVPTESITPSLLLNQFGFASGVAKDYYEEISQYDADLIKDMKLEVTLLNPNNKTGDVCVNFILHELT